MPPQPPASHGLLDATEPRELEGNEIGLSDTLVAALTNFVKTGDPKGPGVPTWETFDPATGPFLEENLTSSPEGVSDYEDNYKCPFWASLQSS
jgi:carboxylesterase type B